MALSHPIPEEKMNKIREEYLKTVPDKLLFIDQKLDEMKEEIQEEHLRALRLHVHRIAGSAGTYGFPKVSTCCKQFEQEILNKMQELKDSTHDPKWINGLYSYLEMIKEGYQDGKF